MHLFVVGEPGAGKTTVAEALAKILEVPILSTGTFARNIGMGKEDSIKEKDLSMQFNERINNEVHNHLAMYPRSVIEGWPRSLEQMGLSKTWAPVSFYLYVSAHPMTAVERVLSRDRDPNDEREIWLGRYRAANKLLGILRKEIGYIRAAVYRQDVEPLAHLVPDVKDLFRVT